MRRVSVIVCISLLFTLVPCDLQSQSSKFTQLSYASADTEKGNSSYADDKSTNLAPTYMLVPTVIPRPIVYAPPKADEYQKRFMTLWNKMHNSNNGYFSDEGIPYYSVETLICETPDYGHEATSETFSYYMWLEAMYGKFTGDWSEFEKAWDITEKYIIPSAKMQKNIEYYDPNRPASYTPEWENTSSYPSSLDLGLKSGQDPIGDDLKNIYGTSRVFGMHWILDVDNWYGYGNMGDGSSRASYINTFQRGVHESVWETIPHPSWDAFSWGGPNGFEDLFSKESSYSAQWSYTNAPDADARAIQATFWANKWAEEQGKSISSYAEKASKMGDYLRYSLFDKYFMKIGSQDKTAGTGYDSAHYLMSRYYSWGAAIDSTWAWKVGCSHNHFGYQNPMTAWILSDQESFQPRSEKGAEDWGKSLERQLEFYQWLQSDEGAIAGGATNSFNGKYEKYPEDVSTFYGMAFQTDPVYLDPKSNSKFDFQAWSMQRMAEYYYQTGDKRAEVILEKWVKWVKSVVKLNSDGTFEIPCKIRWSGQPDTWTGSYTGNKNLHVVVEEYGVDLGVSASLANALVYYSAATKNWGVFDEGSKTLAKEILDRMWNLYEDGKGLSSIEKRSDYKRMFEEEVYVPEGWRGIMATGESIKPGVSFIDLRKKYKDDPEWANVQEAYGEGKDPEFRYHRFVAQSDIAIANGVYSLMFGSPAIPTVFPTTANLPLDSKSNKKNESKADGLRVYGDVSGNGVLDNGDYALVKSFLDKQVKELPNPEWRITGDVNLDGYVDSLDLMFVRRKMIGVIDNLPFT